MIGLVVLIISNNFIVTVVLFYTFLYISYLFFCLFYYRYYSSLNILCEIFAE